MDDTIVYDNQIGGGDTADPTTALAGGSIQIHKGFRAHAVCRRAGSQ